MIHIQRSANAQMEMLARLEASLTFSESKNLKIGLR